MLLCVPAVSAFQENALFAFSELIKVKTGWLFENVLTGCTVTGSKYSRITQHFEVHTARRREISNQWWGGSDKDIKTCL